MSDFPLLSLSPLDLQKVINKLKSRDYFRLHQTCRDVKQFIRSSRRIFVYLDGRYFLFFNGDKSRWEIYFLDKTRGKVVVDLNALYGTRLEELVPPVQNMGHFEELCDSLKKNRITCRSLDMHLTEWSAEHCLALLKSVKPERIDLDCRNSTRYESLFSVKTLKNVTMQLDLDVESVNLAEWLFSTFEEVTLRMEESKTLNSFLRKILETLPSSPFPNLRKFCLDVSGDKNLPSSEYSIMKVLRDGEELANFYSVIVEHKSIEETMAVYLNAPHFDSLYSITVARCCLTVIQYSCLGSLYY